MLPDHVRGMGEFEYMQVTNRLAQFGQFTIQQHRYDEWWVDLITWAGREMRARSVSPGYACDTLLYNIRDELWRMVQRVEGVELPRLVFK